MPFSLFVLALYIFLQSAPTYDWFTVDPKLLAFVGLVFVAVVVIDAVLWARTNRPSWFKRGSSDSEA